MKLRHTAKALGELDDILTWIAEQSPRGARNVQRRLRTMIDLLAEHPRSGQMTNEPRLRRIVVAPYPYLVFFEAADDEVIIIGVRQGARDPSTLRD